MSRPLPDAAEHLVALSLSARRAVTAQALIAKNYAVRELHMPNRTYHDVLFYLRTSGFDVARGFRIAGKKVRAVSHE